MHHWYSLTPHCFTAVAQPLLHCFKFPIQILILSCKIYHSPLIPVLKIFHICPLGKFITFTIVVSSFQHILPVFSYWSLFFPLFILLLYCLYFYSMKNLNSIRLNFSLYWIYYIWTSLLYLFYSASQLANLYAFII